MTASSPEQLARLLAERLNAVAPIGTRLIGLVGSVAAGKSTLADTLRGPLAEALGAPVEVVGSDGFLLSEDVLRARGILDKKGFPESYDQESVRHFIRQLESDAREVEVPIYSHHARGVDGSRTVPLPSVILIEGVYAFAMLRASSLPQIRVYLDASEADLESFFLARWSHLLPDRAPYVHAAWHDINLPNLREHIIHERAQADVVFLKSADHTIEVR